MIINKKMGIIMPIYLKYYLNMIKV